MENLLNFKHIQEAAMAKYNNIEKNKANFLINSIMILKSFIKDNIDFSTKDEKKKIKEEVIKKMCNLSNELNKYKEIKAISCNLNDTTELNSQYTKDKLREEYIKYMSCIGKLFSDLNVLEKYKNLYNKALSLVNLESLSFEKQKEFSEKGLLTIFSKEYLESLSFEGLVASSVFWSNRLIKDLDNINLALFACYEGDLWEHLLEKEQWEDKENNSHKETLAEFLKKQPEEYYVKTIAKFNMLVQLVDQKRIFMKSCITNMQLKQKKKQVLKNEATDELLQEKANTYWKESIKRECEGEYYKLFKTNLFKDMAVIEKLQNDIFSMYSFKNTDLKILLFNIYKNKNIKNWGFIKEDKHSTKNSSFILLGFDIEGFNSPLRVHIQRDEMINILSKINKDTLIPVYKGSHDFMIGKHNLKKSVYYKITSKQKEEIRKKANEKEPNNLFYKHYKHLNSLANPETVEKEPSDFISLVIGNVYHNYGEDARGE